MPELDQTSDQVAAQFSQASDELSSAQRIFNEDTTADHRQQWPNVYRLESATKLAQDALAAADPKTTRLDAAQELAAAAMQTREAIRAAVDSGGGDLIGSADRLLRATSEIEPGFVPPDVARNLSQIQGEIESTKGKIEGQISEAGAAVGAQRDQAVSLMNEAVKAVSTGREAAEQQAGELGLVTTTIAAHNLAETYAVEAKRTEQQTARYTWSSLVMGVVSVLVTIVGLLTVKEPSSFQTVIAHAAFGLPVALFAAYINSLATTHRREAWRLRHIELQIRTANPFLGLLNTVRREETLAALALRFFPGQEGVSFDGKGALETTPELIDLLRRMIVQQGGNTPTGSTPASTAGSVPLQGAS
ncbi:MAG TPA: hypothetical protein VGC49_13080 [Solirubrobacterales bacterium]